MNLYEELVSVTDGIKWDVVGILHTDNRVSKLPKESRVVTEILQSIIIENLQKWAETRNDVKLTDNAEFGREYPDMMLVTDFDKKIAIDVKSARIKNGDRISRMTLGTYNGYFLYPDEKRLRKNTMSYNDYSEHWIIAVIYEWRADQPTEKIVDIASICIGQKWQFAGKYQVRATQQT